MSIGVPYRDALEMPLDMALAMLSDERQDNTHPTKHKPVSNPSPTRPRRGTTYIATRFRNAHKGQS